MKEFAYIHEEGHLPPPLQKLPLLESFSEDQLNDILFSSYFLECDPGDTFILEGSTDSRIYVLLAGTVRVEKQGETIACSSRPGDLFGELAVFSHEHRSASVIADTHALLLVVDQKFLQEVKPIQENGEFYAAVYGFLAKIMASRLRRTSEALAKVERELDKVHAELDQTRAKFAKLEHEIEQKKSSSVPRPRARKKS